MIEKEEKIEEAKPELVELKAETKEKEEPIKEEKPKKERRKKPSYQLLLFEKYDLSGIEVKDPGLARYINLNPIVIHHSGARYANKPFGKMKGSLIERMINNMMRTEHFTGKKTKAYKTVKLALEIIENRTKGNPVQVLVEALARAAPREEITRLRFGGISVPKAVDISPLRRLDIAMRNICKGAMSASFKSVKPIEECLANEILLASKGDMNSFSISKKEEMERVAASAR